MKKSDNKFVEKGLGFGVTSGIITTLGMIVGLDSVFLKNPKRERGREMSGLRL